MHATASGRHITRRRNLNFGVGCSICLDEVRILSSPGNAFSDVDCVFRFVVSGKIFDV
jgi:hypothetical protein